jgi:beta-glucosidase
MHAPSLTISILFLFFFAGCTFYSTDKNSEPLNGTEISYIISNLTINEKTAFLQNSDPKQLNGISRFNIPALRISSATNAVWEADSSILFPSPIAWAATWNTDLITSLSGTYSQIAKNNKISILESPSSQVYRIPQYGSNFQGFGEDPYLISKMFGAYINTIQTQQLAVSLSNAFVSHQETLADLHNIYLDNRTLHELYLAPYREIIRTNPPAMLHLNNQLINEQRTSENEDLVSTVLKEKLNFPGIVLSKNGNTNVSSILAGSDMHLGKSAVFSYDSLQPYLLARDITLSEIDKRLHTIIHTFNSFELYTRQIENVHAPSFEEQYNLAKSIAQESIVLLKNQDNVLPLSSNKIAKLAYIDLNAFNDAQTANTNKELNTTYNVPELVERLENIGSQKGITVEQISVLPSFNQLVNESKFYIPKENETGISIHYFDKANFTAKPVKQANTNEFSVQLNPLHTVPNDSNQTWVVIESTLKVAKSGKYNLKLQTPFNSTLYIGNNIAIIAGSEKTASMFSEEKYLRAGVNYKVRLIQRIEYAGEVKLACFIPTEPDLKSLEKKLSKFDGVFLTAGFNKYSEGQNIDRSFYLPADQQRILEFIGNLNLYKILSISAGGSVEMDSYIQNTESVLFSFYQGIAGPEALANILFGKVSPSGKLPFSIEGNWKNSPCFYSFDTSYVKLTIEEQTIIRSKFERLDTDYAEGFYTGYRFYDRNGIDPLYPFGFGLSYSSFKYGNTILSKKIIDRDQFISIDLEIQNTGKLDAHEVIQLYVHDIRTSVERPVKELKGFKKVFLKAGEKKVVSFKLHGKDMAFYHPEKEKWIVEPGEYMLMLGSSSNSIHVTEKFSIE